MQNQLVCTGCRTILVYPGGATNVRCALCNTVTPIPPIPPPGTGMAQLVCGGCRTMLMYRAGATSVRCSCCQTLNLASASNQLAHINCGNCRTMLMYPYGAPSVKCALCHYVTNNDVIRAPLPMQGPNLSAISGSMPSTSHSQSQTVVVENPMSINESGKLVSNVVVGVTTSKK